MSSFGKLKAIISVVIILAMVWLNVSIDFTALTYDTRKEQFIHVGADKAYAEDVWSLEYTAVDQVFLYSTFFLILSSTSNETSMHITGSITDGPSTPPDAVFDVTLPRDPLRTYMISYDSNRGYSMATYNLESNQGTFGFVPGDYYAYVSVKIYSKPISSNSSPTLSVVSPSAGSIFTQTSTYLSPQVYVSDVDNDALTCKYYIDSATTPSEVKTVSYTGTYQTVSFSPINVAALSDGSHAIKFETSDGKSAAVMSSINFVVDKTGPAITSVILGSTTDSITVTGTATDNMFGLSTAPYNYKIGDKESGWITGSPHSESGFSPNTQYSVIFFARDANGNVSNSNTYNIYTKAVVPSLTVNNPTSSTLDVTINDNNPATTQYEISVNNGSQYVTNEGGLTSSPTLVSSVNKKITVTGLSSAKTYTFQARAKNAGDNENPYTAQSSSVSGTTLIKPPAPPINLIATATSNQITVSWDAAATATGYEIMADGRTIDVGTNLKYTHAQLSPGTPHTYQVRARNAGGTGNWSTQITKSTLPTSPDIPVNVVAVPQSTSVTVTWSNVPGATGYDIEVDGTVVANGPSTSYTHSSLSPGTNHSYRVRSINSGGKSDWSVTISVTTTSVSSPVPLNLTAISSKNEISLSWDTVDGATGYELEADGVIIDNNLKTSYVHRSLAAGSQHMYRVRSKKSGVISDWSEAVIAETLSNTFGTPVGLKADANDTSITLSWSPVKDATGYEVEADGVAADNGTDTTALITGLKPRSAHTYRVRAKSASQTSEWSDTLNVSTFDLPTPIIIEAASTETTIEISWQSTTSASATFELEADGAITIPDIAESQYTYGGLLPGTQHEFRVRAKTENGMSNWSIPITKSTILSSSNAPMGLFAMVKSSSAVIMWQPMEGAASYDIDADGVLTENITDLKYIHTGLLPGSQYTYKIRANKDTGKTEWSDEFTVQIKPEGPAVPANVTASSTTSKILVTWDEVTGADEYEIEVDGKAVIQIGKETSYLHGGVAPDTLHTYRVRSKNSTGYSAWSETVSIKSKSSTMTYELDSVTGEEFDLVFSAADIQDIGQYTFTVSYDSGKLEVTDLCGITSKIDNSAGAVTGTDIQIVQFTPGTIVFKKTSSDQSYQAWSGIVDTIRFKALADGQTNVIYSFQ